MFKRMPILAAAYLLLSFNAAKADLITYTDRSLFESQLASFTVDGLNSINAEANYSGYSNGDMSFDGYYFGCINNPGCGSPHPMGDAYISIQTSSPLSFSFANSVAALGFDYANTNFVSGDVIYLRIMDSVQLELNVFDSLLATDASGIQFFGVIDTDGLLFSGAPGLVVGGGHAFIDNITYGTYNPGSAPAPATFSLLVAGLLGISASRKKFKFKRLKAH